MKRIVSLVAVLAMAAVTGFAVVAHAGSSTAALTRVRVTAKDFSFTLSRHRAPHGRVTFVVTNTARDKHDFKIAGKATPRLGHNRTASITVRLVRGRTYTYVCTVPGHAALGMKGKFRAT